MQNLIPYDNLIRNLISDIIAENNDVISIAIQNRNKFEGWLKFELANKLQKQKFKEVFVESKYERRRDRYDLIFTDDEYLSYSIELKTPNTNWSITGVSKCSRPITKNINSIISDTKKLNSRYGIIAFVLFPIPKGCNKWTRYFEKIKNECNLPIEIEENCKRIKIKFDEKHNECDVIVCTYFSKQYSWI
ncbi:hypothetical protein [Flavobacterium sp. ACN6]|uniref:hypothetical protein n=1 Tax=Flavobacterium sp. ACN6 TaxID=1920426 RepID=UPI001144AEEA|nr:hypothetical protein [Flavobacterium sp. ACN6]PBJ08066.1 hypothetical protein BSF42_37830 [Flavobacterium sp. ACN6]